MDESAGFNHKALLASLTVEQRRTLCAQSDRPALIHMGLHLGLVAALGIWIATGQPFWWLVMLPQGILLVFLFTALHELIHRTAFASDRLNDAFAVLCGFIVLLPPHEFRYFHLAHHRFTHDPANDPELAGPKPDTLWSYLKYLSGLPEIRWRIANLMRNAVVQSQATYVPLRARARVMREARLFLFGYLLLAGLSIVTVSALLVWVWLFPMLIAAPALRGYLLAEHARCPHVADMLANTRTTFTNRLMRWLAWNMPYHAEHHAYPAVPFHKLPEFHAICADHLKVTQDGYVPFNADYARDAAKAALNP